MMFAQFTARTSLRDITLCLGSHTRKLYHAGFRGAIARSTLADANERRDCRIFEDFAMHLNALYLFTCKSVMRLPGTVIASSRR
jgi:hypothetical protein